jgi:hypothetical protein
MSRAFADLVAMGTHVEAGTPSEPELTTSLTRYDGGWSWSRAADLLAGSGRPAAALKRAQLAWDRERLGYALNNLLDAAT